MARARPQNLMPAGPIDGGELHKFLFEGLPVRGMLVRLTDSWQELLARREHAGVAFPQPVRQLLGEMAAAGTLMQSNIKFNGELLLQVTGDGPVRLKLRPVVHFRGYEDPVSKPQPAPYVLTASEGRYELRGSDPDYPPLRLKVGVN